MKKRILICLLVLLLSLTGCMADSNELLRLPQLPQQYMLVQAQLDQILSDNTQLSAPVSGENRGAIQMADLNGDNIDEVLAFCKTQKDASVVMQVYIFKLERGKYTQFAVLEGVGDSFDLCAIARMGLEKLPVLIVGWRLGANPVCGLTAYRMEEKNMTQMYTGEYTGLVIEDVDVDSNEELLVLRHQADASTAGTATLLNFESGQLTPAGTAPLSATVASPLRMSYDDIGGGKMGVVVDGSVDENRIVTDVICFLEGKLVNLTYDVLTMESSATLRPAAYLSTDIDGDNVMEIPMVSPVMGTPAGSRGPLLITNWYSYEEERGLVRKLSGYWETNGKWFCIIPDTLLPSVTITIGESVGDYPMVVFSRYDGEAERIGASLWEICCFEGPNRLQNLEHHGLLELARTGTRVYGVRMHVQNQEIISVGELSSLFILS